MTQQSFYRGVVCTALLCASTGVVAAPTNSATLAAGQGSAGAPSAAAAAGAESAAVPPTAGNFNDAKLEKFADAYVAVQQIQKDAAGQGASAGAAGATNTDLQVKMKTAVEQTGLQVEEFNQIAQQMVTDLDLRSKVAEKVQARAGRSE